MNSITIGKRLTLLRGNVPQKDVAAAVGISVTALSMYETGNRIPRDEIKIKLAQHYGRTVEEIFFAK
ncbi:MAG: helix-turn-helix transcriptional regulator [Clostridia bacterium]|nr:helix-turn-helix transcriptional regulator [Clostridia bacterium]MBR6509432.1 helix-turn-helix transcriptional regulator [Clostridia bacterium]